METLVEKFDPSKLMDGVKDRIKAKPEYSIASIWEYNNNTNIIGNKVQLSEHLDSMIKEKMPDMMQAMLSSVMADAFYKLFSQLQNNMHIR